MAGHASRARKRLASSRVEAVNTAAIASNTAKEAEWKGRFVALEAELVEARNRGVEIEIIIPGSKSDTPIVRYASRGKWGPLLRAGVKIYEYQPTMYHCKMMIMDDVWVSVGSANFDNRSFRLNDEANLNVYSAEFAAEQTRIFEQDKEKSRQFTYEDWQNRPLRKRIMETLTAPFRAQRVQTGPHRQAGYPMREGHTAANLVLVEPVEEFHENLLRQVFLCRADRQMAAHDADYLRIKRFHQRPGCFRIALARKFHLP